MSIAHELITRGWAHGVLVNASGEVCLMGAAIAAYGEKLADDYALWDELPLHVRRALVVAVGGDPLLEEPLLQSEPVYRFNDDHDEFDDVLRVAKEADEILDGLR